MRLKTPEDASKIRKAIAIELRRDPNISKSKATAEFTHIQHPAIMDCCKEWFDNTSRTTTIDNLSIHVNQIHKTKRKKMWIPCSPCCPFCWLFRCCVMPCCTCCYVQTIDIVDQELYHKTAGSSTTMTSMPNASFTTLFRYWLLGGLFGCHRFKSRHNKMGFVFLFLWLAAIINFTLGAVSQSYINRRNRNSNSNNNRGSNCPSSCRLSDFCDGIYDSACDRSSCNYDDGDCNNSPNKCSENTVTSRVGYSQVVSGRSCGAAGLYDIRDKDECENALRALGFVLTGSSSGPGTVGASKYPTEYEMRPSGCSVRSYVNSYGGCAVYGSLNTNHISSASCTVGNSDGSTCICSSTKSEPKTCSNGASDGGPVSCVNSWSHKPGSTVCGESNDDSCEANGATCCVLEKPPETCGNGGINGKAVSCDKSASAKSSSTICGAEPGKPCDDDSAGCCIGLTKLSDACEERRCNAGGGGDMCVCGDPSDQDSPENCCNGNMGLCPSCPSASGASYFAITNTDCSAQGMESLTSRAECGIAANALGLSITNALGLLSGGTPKGCFYYNGGGSPNLYLNSSPSSTATCSSNRPCLCKRISRRRMNDNDSTDSITVQTIQRTLQSPSLNSDVPTFSSYGFDMSYATEQISSIVTEVHLFYRRHLANNDTRASRPSDTSNNDAAETMMSYIAPQTSIAEGIIGTIVLLWLMDLFKLRSMLDTTYLEFNSSASTYPSRDLFGKEWECYLNNDKEAEKVIELVDKFTASYQKGHKTYKEATQVMNVNNAKAHRVRRRSSKSSRQMLSNPMKN